MGRFTVSKMVEDTSAFKVPTLRSVGISGPYFHDGSAKTLEDTVEHFVRFFAISPRPTLSERADLLAYLRSL